ncbi:MAG: 50S ribosomal protein L15 [Candidatus Cloacimonadota bacterium]|nr:MAG: 50S ribosomal protein L15 [Candidatus Cloacimonadota bacterium]
MRLDELKRPNKLKKKKRLGKGSGSGWGKTAGRGMNGQKCRSGKKVPVWFEGGQMPIHRRLPRRGFNNKFRIENRVVNLYQLAKLEQDVVDIKLMEEKGLIPKGKTKSSMPVKVLAYKADKLNRPITVIANKFSRIARDIIEQNKGKVEVI